MDRVLRRWAPIVGVGLLLAAAWAAAALSSLQVSNLAVPVLQSAPPAEEGSVPSAPPPVPPESASAGGAVPGWMTTLAAVVCTAVALVVIGALAWYLIRDRRGMRPVPELAGAAVAASGTRTDVVAAVDAGLSELSQADTDPRRAIIACWVRLEQAAAGAGVLRRASDSPTDLVLRLLDTAQVSAGVLDGFAIVYREARYTTHPMHDRTRRSAVAALQHVRAELVRVQAPDQSPAGRAPAGRAPAGQTPAGRAPAPGGRR